MSHEECEIVQQAMMWQEENIVLHQRISKGERIIQDAELTTMLNMKEAGQHPSQIVSIVETNRLREALYIEPSAKTQEVFNLIKDMGV